MKTAAYITAMVAVWCTTATAWTKKPASRPTSQRASRQQEAKPLPLAPRGMRAIAAGFHLPLYKTKTKRKTRVRAFYLDIYPVTNQEFLAFVKARPRWRRDRVPSLFADHGYLKHWRGPLVLGSASLRRSPVIRVSWFAARRYCRWRRKRLPRVAEWEYVAAASQKHRRGHKEPGYNARILRWYSRPTPTHLPPVGSTVKNAWGVYDMHGLVWEWTRDFQSALVTGESRGDSALEKQLFCGAGAVGTSDFTNYAAFMRFAFRSSLKAQYTTANLGFRCARDLAQPRPHPSRRTNK